jgi:hypothetical protein
MVGIREPSRKVVLEHQVTVVKLLGSQGPCRHQVLQL